MKVTSPLSATVPVVLQVWPSTRLSLIVAKTEGADAWLEPWVGVANDELNMCPIHLFIAHD